MAISAASPPLAAVSKTLTASSRNRLTNCLSDRDGVSRVESLFYRPHYQGDALGRRLTIGAALNVRLERRLVGIVEAGDAVYLACAAAAIETLPVALLR